MRLRRFASRISHSSCIAPKDQLLSLKPLNSRLYQHSASSNPTGLGQFYPGVRAVSLPFYVGTDICHVPRVERLLFTAPQDSNRGSEEGSIQKPTSILNHRFLRRVFNEFELDYIHKKILSKLDFSQKDSFTKFVAGR
jgi:hypothetical protein